MNLLLLFVVVLSAFSCVDAYYNTGPLFTPRLVITILGFLSIIPGVCFAFKEWLDSPHDRLKLLAFNTLSPILGKYWPTFCIRWGIFLFSDEVTRSPAIIWNQPFYYRKRPGDYQEGNLWVTSHIDSGYTTRLCMGTDDDRIDWGHKTPEDLWNHHLNDCTGVFQFHSIDGEYVISHFAAGRGLNITEQSCASDVMSFIRKKSIHYKIYKDSVSLMNAAVAIEQSVYRGRRFYSEMMVTRGQYTLQNDRLLSVQNLEDYVLLNDPIPTHIR